MKYARAVYAALRDVRADVVEARRCIVDAQEGTMDTRVALRQARAAVARANDRLTTLLADGHRGLVDRTGSAHLDIRRVAHSRQSLSDPRLNEKRSSGVVGQQTFQHVFPTAVCRC